ncbi:MAG: hypothetical protein JXC32_10185 [Anaerolineae bacterium]|nr:hypothetical protein [Anaerolineae bacterium]
MVKLDQHDFTLATLTEFGVVTPLDFDVRHVDNGIKATSRACALYGDSRRPYSGRMDLWVERTEGGAMRWRCTAEMVHPIKGVKITVDPVPGTSVVEAAGNPVDLGDGQGHTTVFPSSWYLATRIPQSGIRRVGTNFAQHLYIHGNGSLLMLSSDDYPPVSSAIGRSGKEITLR